VSWGLNGELVWQELMHFVEMCVCVCVWDDELSQASRWSSDFTFSTDRILSGDYLQRTWPKLPCAKKKAYTSFVA